MIFTIANKELRSLFSAPSTWIILGALQFIFAWFFLARLDAYLQVQTQLAMVANAPGATVSVVAPLFGTLALVLMMLIPLFTMRLLAEERRNQTLVLLLARRWGCDRPVIGLVGEPTSRRLALLVLRPRWFVIGILPLLTLNPDVPIEGHGLTRPWRTAGTGSASPIR